MPNHAHKFLLLLLVSTTRTACGYGGGVKDWEVVPRHSNTNLLHVVADHNHQRDFRRMAGAQSYLSLTGRSQSDIAAKLNLHAAKHASVSQVVRCSDLTSVEVASIARKLKLLVDDGIRLSLPEEDGRQVYADPEVASFFQSPVLHDLQCAETMKLWAHHIPNSVKDNLPTPVTLPALPVFNEEELLAELVQSNKTLSCVAGHTVVDFGTLENDEEGFGVTDWPHWPKKFHFQAKAYGPYPFWQFGPDYIGGLVHDWTVNETFEELYAGADIEVWHNTLTASTMFYHPLCAWNNVGFRKLGQTPCIALQLGVYATTSPEMVGKWLLFTANSSTKTSDEVFCCASTLSTSATHNLGTINRKFMDNMKFLGNVDYNGLFYTGLAKQYSMVMTSPGEGDTDGPTLPLMVWYETDMQDKPLRFAELGRDNKKVLYDHEVQPSDLPYLYEEMDPTSFSETFSETVFDIPEVCNVENLDTCRPGPEYRHGLNIDMGDHPVP